MQELASLPPDMDDELDRNRSRVGVGGVVFLDSPVSVERVEDPLTAATKARFGDFIVDALRRTDLDVDQVELAGL